MASKGGEFQLCHFLHIGSAEVLSQGEKTKQCIYIYIFPKFLDDIRVDIRRKNTTMLLSLQDMFRIVPIHHQLLITMKKLLGT